MSIFDDYHKKHLPSRIQVESYNHLIQQTIPSIIHSSTFHIPISHSQYYMIQFNNIYMTKPQIYDEQRNNIPLLPNDARNQNLHYETLISTDITSEIIDINTKRVLQSTLFPKSLLFKLPVMVGSSLCNTMHGGKRTLGNEEEYGGYFIIKGKERVLVAQERINYNLVYVYKQKIAKYEYIAEVRSVKEDADYSVLFQLKIDAQKNIFANIHHIKNDIPLGILLLLTGMEDINTFLSFFHHEKHREIIEFNLLLYQHYTLTDAFSYFEKMDAKNITNLVKEDMFPHLGLYATEEDKLYYLSRVCRKLLDTFLGIHPEDNRDHMSNKRVESTGHLIFNLVKGLFKKMMKNIQQHIEKRKEDNNIINIINRFSITPRIYHCFTTGKWGIPKSNYIRQGVSQILNRMSFIGTLSHLQRANVPIGKESKNTNVRQIHPSSYGFYDPITTPEGASSGIVKDFAIYVRISEDIPSTIIIDLLFSLYPYDILPISRMNDTTERVKMITFYLPILVNGMYVGLIEKEKYKEFIFHLKKERRNFNLPRELSISYDHVDEEILLFSDGGRMLRAVCDPMVEIEKEKENDWEYRVQVGSIVYIDANEQESSYIQFPDEEPNHPDYTELDPGVIFGTCSGVIPFSNHSQAPRNIYLAAMSKQAIGVYDIHHPSRFDTITHILHYPQKHLTTTRLSVQLGMEDLPAGVNTIVAVMAYSGLIGPLL